MIQNTTLQRATELNRISLNHFRSNFQGLTLRDRKFVYTIFEKNFNYDMTKVASL